MCNPAFVMIGIAAVSAIGSLQAGQASKDASEQNAQYAEQNAAISRDKANFDATLQARESGQLLGKARAQIAKSGVAYSGSPIDVMADSAAQAELDNLAIRYGGELAARGYLNQADISRREGKQAQTASYFGAATSLLKGASAAYGGTGTAAAGTPLKI